MDIPIIRNRYGYLDPPLPVQPSPSDLQILRVVTPAVLPVTKVPRYGFFPG